jgi:hypothetical protein
MLTLLHYVAVVLLSRYVYREAKAWLLARHGHELARTADDVAHYLRAAAYHDKYMGRRLKARYYLLYPCCVAGAIGVVVMMGGGGGPCPPCATVNQTGVVCASGAATPALKSCLTASAASPWCYTRRLWQRPVVAQYQCAAPDQQQQRRFYVDSRRDYYFSTVATEARFVEEGAAEEEEEDRHLVTGPVLVKERHLKLQLAQRHAESGDACICAAAMGLADSNLTFLLLRQPAAAAAASDEWIILYDAAQTLPSPPEARRVRTRVATHRGEVTLEHDDQLTVTFSAPQFKFGSDQEVADLVHLQASDESIFILRRLQAPESARLSIVLGGADAVCFIYCRRFHQPPYHHQQQTADGAAP